jgi:hypothetical protein
MHGHSGTSDLFYIWFGVHTVTAKTTFRDDIYSQSIKGSYMGSKEKKSVLQSLGRTLQRDWRQNSTAEEKSSLESF